MSKPRTKPEQELPPELVRLIKALARKAAREDHALETARRAELSSRA